MGDKSRGVYEKFTVTRTDGKSEPGEKHDGCRYFVLDLDHDPHAVPAIAAYAYSCRAAGYYQMADELQAWLKAQSDDYVQMADELDELGGNDES